MASNLLSNKHSESQYRENYVESYKRRDGGGGGLLFGLNDRPDLCESLRVKCFVCVR